VVDIGVAVGQGGGVEFRQGGVEANEPVLEVAARASGRARRAADEVEPSVEVDHRPAPGGLVQPVQVLGEEDRALAIRFKAGQSVMRVVGQGLTEPSRRSCSAPSNGDAWLPR
jgi:hypothetical protein